MVYCLSAMVSMERFFVIAFPMKARYIKLIRYPKVCIAAMAVLVLAIHIYLPLKYQVSPSPSGVGYSMVYTDAFKANQEVFDDVANSARYIFSYFPLALCLVLSVALMMALKRHAASRQSLQEVRDDGKGNDSDKAERQLAMTIWVCRTFRFLGFEHRLYSLVGRFCYVALIATRYTNFLAYVCLSTSFRHNLIRLLCPEKVVRSLLVGRTESEDTPQPTISKETYDRLMPILNLFNLIFDAVSIVLTFTSACIYALPNMHCATAHYLVALNAAETVSGLLVVVKRTRDVIWGATTPYTAWFGYLTLIGTLMVSVSCRRTVYCLTAMVSMERFFVITFPLKARYMKLIRYPKVCIGCVAVSALVFHTYLPLKYKVAPSRTGVDYTITVTEVFRDNEQLFDDVANVAKFLFSYIPLGFCLALSLALMAGLKRQAASRQSLQESRDEGKARIIRSGERQLAMTIWISTLLFALLSLPSNTAHLISTFHSTFYFNGFEHRLYRLVDTCAQIPLIASRFTNFLSYLGLSTAFRRNLLRIFFCKNCRDSLSVPYRNRSCRLLESITCQHGEDKGKVDLRLGPRKRDKGPLQLVSDSDTREDTALKLVLDNLKELSERNHELKKALSTDPPVEKEFCTCVDAQSSEEAVEACLCSDNLDTWWQRAVTDRGLRHCLPADSPSGIHRLSFDFEKNAEDVDKAVDQLAAAASDGELYLIADEAHHSRNTRGRFKEFCTKLAALVPTLHLWAAAVKRDVTLSGCMEERRLTKLLREFQHRGQPGHITPLPEDCERCADKVVSLIEELRINQTSKTGTANESAHGFDSIWAWRVVLDAGFLRVCPVQPHFLRRICLATGIERAEFMVKFLEDLLNPLTILRRDDNVKDFVTQHDMLPIL
nr:hypothetical protein BaRGS_008602 [Batillaria attramentaria]